MTRVFAIVPFRTVLAIVIGGDIVVGLALGRYLNSGDAADPGMMKTVSVMIPLLVLLVVIPLATVAMRPWRYFADIDAMRAGHAWVHWTYDEAGWTAANEVEGRRTRRTGFTGVLVLLGLAVVVLLIGLAVGGEDGSGITFVGGMMAGLAIVAAGAFGATSPAVVARRRKRGEVYISRLGIYRRPGGYTPMFSFGVSLANVVLAGPVPHLSFEATVQGRGGPRVESLADVAVPPGREEEARALANRLRTEVLGTA